MKYASVIPLIGGESLGIMEATNGQLPEYVLSYSPFKNNDSHYIQYIREKRGWTGDYVFLDEDTNYKPAEVDVVNTVCPCAGLSSLSVSSSASSAVNDWLYTTAEYVLREIGPKVFWGENAPRLYTSAGADVADRLYEIGQRYGYSLNLYYTESRLHGLAQKRPRTFYFFTRSERAPLFPWHRGEFEPIERIFERDTDPNDPMNIRGNNDDPMDNPWLRYCMHKTGSETIMDYFNAINKSTNCIVESDRGFDGTLYDVADWMRVNGYDRFADRAVAMQKKLEDGKGYWAHGITMGKGEIPSLIGAQPHYLINAYTARYVTIRECMRIMKMPDDFNLAGDNPRSKINHICQNVPVSTAADMMRGIMAYLAGQTDFGPSSYVKQNNKSRVYSSALTVKEDSNTEPLDAFFHLH